MKKPNRKISFSLSLKMGLSLIASFLAAAAIVVTVVAILDLFGTDFFIPRPVLLLALSFATSILVGAGVLMIVIKLQSKKIEEFRARMSSVANGNYSVRLPRPGKNDIFYAEITEDFNKLIDRLNSTAILQSDFASNFSHEFKTPIVSIKGYAEILAKKTDLSAEERDKYLKIIIDETDRLTKLASSTLLLSKLDAGSAPENPTDVDVAEQIEECVLLLDRSLREKDIEIELDLAPFTLYANADLLKEIWINLLSNAVKYNREGGKIFVTSQILPDCYAICFRDTGIGMDEETLSRAFDKYYQGDRSHVGKGNGLGLSIVKRIVELSGGEIEAESKAGEGSAFTLKFPRA